MGDFKVDAQCDTKINPTCKLAEGAGFNACSVNCNEGVNGGVDNAGSATGVSGGVDNAG